MRFAHLSDLHLGYKTGNKTRDEVNIRELDGYTAYQALIDDILTQGVDFVVISGDSFHTPKPTVRAIITFQDGLKKLAAANIPVRIIAGNHDVTDYKGDIAASKIAHDPDRGILSHAEPYVVSQVLPDVYVHMISHHMYRSQADTMSQVTPIEGGVNILATHGSVIDPLLKERIRVEESPREIVIPEHFLTMGWDVMALGHIHERGWVGPQENGVYYNGSLIRRGFSDNEGTLGRGYTVWDDTTGVFTPEFHNVPQRPQIDFPVVDAANLTAADITGIILDNLKNTSIDGAGFNHETAPILRQKVINIPPATTTGLDYPAILEASRHALTWQLDLTRPQHTPDTAETKRGPRAKHHDMVSAFQEWAPGAENLQNLEQPVAEAVIDQSTRFVQFGQDKALELKD